MRLNINHPRTGANSISFIPFRDAKPGGNTGQQLFPQNEFYLQIPFRKHGDKGWQKPETGFSV